MKTILAIALLVAILAIPAALAAPDSNPNGNPILDASLCAIWKVGDGSGFSEWGQFAALLDDMSQDLRGVSSWARHIN